MGKWSREERLGIYSTVPVWSAGKLVQSSSSHLVASSVPFHQLLCIRWPVPGTPQLLLLFYSHLPPPAAQLRHLRPPLELGPVSLPPSPAVSTTH